MCAHCYKVAGEASRHRILALLKTRQWNVGALAGKLRLTQPTVTHHLNRLKAAGLIRMKKDGREHVYDLARGSDCFKECGLLKGL